MNSVLLAQVAGPNIFSVFAVAAVLILIAGFYSVMVTGNLIRTVIGLEILTKSVTLLIILVGYLTGQMGLALVITLIIIEVVLTAVAVGVILCIYRHEHSIGTETVRKLKG